MNYCEECIVYQIQNDKSKPDFCENCGIIQRGGNLVNMGLHICNAQNADIPSG